MVFLESGLGIVVGYLVVFLLFKKLFRQLGKWISQNRKMVFSKKWKVLLDLSWPILLMRLFAFVLLYYFMIRDLPGSIVLFPVSLFILPETLFLEVSPEDQSNLALLAGLTIGESVAIGAIVWVSLLWVKNQHREAE